MSGSKKKVKPFDRLSPWLQDIILNQGLMGALSIRAMDLAQQAEMTERGRKSAQNKHAKTAALKLEAANEYAKIKSQYRSKKEAARHLHNMFGKVAFSTYLKWVSQWP